MKKGISLIVLIITIIVMIIIAGAVIISLNDSDIIDRAEEAVEKHNESELKNTVSVLAMQYKLEDTDKSCKDYVEEKLLGSGFSKDDLTKVYITDACGIITGEENIRAAQESEIRRVHQTKLKTAYNYDLTDETIDEMIRLMNAANIPAEKLFVWYDKYDQKDYVGYRLDKVTYEECVILEGIQNEETGYPYMFLPGDCNLDGLLTQEDVDLINEQLMGSIRITEYTKLYIIQAGIMEEEINKIRIDVTDVSVITSLYDGSWSYKELIEGFYTNIENYVHDGKNYFTNEALRQGVIL